MERHRLDDAGCGPAPAKPTDLPETLGTGWQGALKDRGASTETWPMDHRKRKPAKCRPAVPMLSTRRVRAPQCRWTLQL
jgi:hypothetical protein